MEEGTILRWLKSVGDEVKRGDELVEIETDKANMTYEAIDEGMLVEIVADEGDTLPIGETIARIGAPGEASVEGAPKKRAAEAGRKSPRPEPEPSCGPAGRNAEPSGARSRRAAGEWSREGFARRAPHGARAERAARADPGIRARRAHREGRCRSGRRRTAGQPRTRRRLPAPSAAPRPRRQGRDAGGRAHPPAATVARRMAESKATVPHFYL